MTLRTIHPIGKKPVTAPSTVARNARPDGMVKIKIATRLATMSATMAAICAFTLLDAMSTNSVTTGKAAASVDKIQLLKGS
jgi:glycerol-3-phosphate responsive antiterminator